MRLSGASAFDSLSTPFKLHRGGLGYLLDLQVKCSTLNSDYILTPPRQGCCSGSYAGFLALRGRYIIAWLQVDVCQ